MIGQKCVRKDCKYRSGKDGCLRDKPFGCRGFRVKPQKNRKKKGE